MPTTGRTGNGDTLTGVGTWDVLFNAGDPTVSGHPCRVFSFLCPTAAVKLRITGLHDHVDSGGNLVTTQFETIAAGQYVERGATRGGLGLISKVEAQPVAAGTPACYWGPALA
jgi:hypothetical protein